MPKARSPMASTLPTHGWSEDNPDGKDHLTVATTHVQRLPAGDSAVAVHLRMSDIQNLIGGFIELPLVGRKIEIIADSYVDMEFGTGCVKITPTSTTSMTTPWANAIS